MPTKDRRERERQKKALNKKWDEIVSIAPAHIQKRLGQPSALSEQLHTKGQHNAPWAKYDEYGNPLPREDPEDLGANSNRKSTREDDAFVLRKKYPDIWGKRGNAKVIAIKEKLNIRTVQKYFKDFPI
jgi:hypothetical protein